MLHTDQGKTNCKVHTILSTCIHIHLTKIFGWNFAVRMCSSCPMFPLKYEGQMCNLVLFFLCCGTVGDYSYKLYIIFFFKYDIAFYKVKLSLCTEWRQCGSHDMTPLILNLSTETVESSQLYSPAILPLVQGIRMWLILTSPQKFRNNLQILGARRVACSSLHSTHKSGMLSAPQCHLVFLLSASKLTHLVSNKKKKTMVKY